MCKIVEQMTISWLHNFHVDGGVDGVGIRLNN